jgi:hypothetical protein
MKFAHLFHQKRDKSFGKWSSTELYYEESILEGNLTKAIHSFLETCSILVPEKDAKKFQIA